MTTINEKFYLERGEMNYQLREYIEKIADSISERGFQNIFFVGSGGSIEMLRSFADYFKKLSNIPVYTDTSAEFAVAQYKQLTKDSLVILVSKTGDAEEAVQAARYCQERGITTVGFVGVKDSTIYNIVSHKIFIDEDISAFRYIQVYFLAFRLLYNLGHFEDYPRFSNELKKLPKALLETAKQFDSVAKIYAEQHYQDPFQLWIGSGANIGEISRYSACVAEELFRIKTQAMHSAEFFHGCFEIVDEHTPVVLIKGEDESRGIDKRVEKFLEKYSGNSLIIDTKDFPLEGISPDFRKYFAPAVISILLGDRLRINMAEKTGLSYNTRKYYRVVSY
ncbi:SIS domain-containing protein [Robertmurraya korlensis]|uniref:SIS domain-containing protein n=1 Tax=Robertmurraya korlensis TaxID=519977 RepID=UPI0008240881|nr:SIS domain-containing protein [Robertmurraya korlensis]